MDGHPNRNSLSYTFALDSHEYIDSRFRIQIVFLFLLSCVSGERPGAITRSRAYRDTNIALVYEVFDAYRRSDLNKLILAKDIELLRKPSLDGAPQFSMHITFYNRKGERLNEMQK